MPGYKRINVTLVLHTYEDVPDDWDAEQVAFHVEENHCLGNYLLTIQGDEELAAEKAEIKPPAVVCQLCCAARAYVGHKPFPGEET